MKKIIVILAVIVLVGVVVFIKNKDRVSPVSTVDLDRPLIVGVVSWPGYAGGITANKGFQENAESIFTKQFGLPVRFVLIEDIDARGKAFAKGGPDGVDVVWSTVDFWANELQGFSQGGVDAAAILQVDWSQGGDAIVANNNIRSVEDLQNKKIALVQFTPSHWLLETVLRQSKLTNEQQEKIRQNLVFTQDVTTARSAFVAGQVDAAVLWEPDVKQALKKDQSHILTSTSDFPNTIADVMVAKKDFIAAHPRAIEAFVRGWLAGVEEAKANPDLAATLLIENEPLFQDLGLAATKESLQWVSWTDLEDNAKFFGLNNQAPLFDSLFTKASEVWQALGIINKPLNPANAKDDSIVKKLYQDKN